MKIKDLVVLRYCFNECYVEVVSVQRARKESKLVFDLNAGTWGKGNKIGKGLHMSSYQGRDGIIGVYDRTELSHLNQMTYDAVEGTREDSHFGDD